jgi:hypothetical protein
VLNGTLRAGKVATSLVLLAVAACAGPSPAQPAVSRPSTVREVDVTGVTNWRSGTLDWAICSQLGDGELDLLLLGPSQLQVRVAVRAGKLSTIVASDGHSDLLVRDTTDGTLTFADQAVTLEGVVIRDREHVVKLNGSVGCRPS